MSRKKFQKTYITFERRVFLEFTFFCVIDDVSKKDSSHFFQGKKMWGFSLWSIITLDKRVGRKMILSSWAHFLFSRKIMAGLACAAVRVFYSIFFDRFLLWKVNGSTPHWYPIVWLESVSKNWVWIFFFWGGVFPEKKRANWKIPKWQGSEIIFIWKMTTLEFQDFIVILRFLVKLLHLLSMLCWS